MTTVCSFDGKQRNCGLEPATCGDVLSGLRLMASVTFHDADGVPKRAINFGVGWDLPWVPGLSLNGRVITTSSPQFDAANRIEVTGWTRTDVGARYRTRIAGKSVVLRANVENVFNDNYWLVSGTYATVAALRTLLLSAQIDFQRLQHDNARHCKQMNIVITRFARVGRLVSRIVCAIFGGYALAALTSVATLALPISKPQAVLTGMLASFIVHVCAVIWVFAVRSALRAWTGCLVAALPLLCAAWTVWSGGHV